MRPLLRQLIYLVFLYTALFVGPNRLLSQSSWTKKLSGVGTFSSPRVADLNQDGVGDIILGAGREEFQACDSAVIALDGKNGELLWKVPAKDQIFGSAAFKDVSGDGVEDVFIGGRSAELIAINGAGGEVIWRFSPKTRGKNGKKVKWFNFYNPQFIPDRDGDGLEDIIVSNGGDVMAEPYDPNRPVGSLLVLSSKTGRLLAQAEAPDGKEIYMSITVVEAPDRKDHEIFFGTGGETIGGNLYLTYLSDLMRGDLSGAKLLDSSQDKGYIGPASRVDLTGDGITDVVSCSVDGRLLAFDGDDYGRLWELIVPGTESYSSAAVGYFNQDSVPDFFVSFARGTWPKLDWSLQKMVNGQTGLAEFTDSLGFYQNTSPLALDLDGDGWDEILMSVNFQEVQNRFQKHFYTMLIMIDFQTGEFQKIGETYQGSNLSSTPWVGDLDQDGLLDIVYCHGDNLRHTYTFDGMKIHRIATEIPVYKKVGWGAYQGSEYTGIYSEMKLEKEKK